MWNLLPTYSPVVTCSWMTSVEAFLVENGDSDTPQENHSEGFHCFLVRKKLKRSGIWKESFLNQGKTLIPLGLF